MTYCVTKAREIPNAESLSCCFEDRAARTVCSLTRVAHIPASLPKKISDSTTLATDSSRTLCCASHGKTTAPSDHLRLQPDTHHPGCTLVLFGNGFLGCCYTCRNQTICFPCREGGISVASRILSILHRTVNGCADPMWIWLGKACCILEQCTSPVQPQGRVCSNDTALLLTWLLQTGYRGISMRSGPFETAPQAQLRHRSTCMFLDVVRIACGSLPVRNITPMGQDAQTMSEQVRMVECNNSSQHRHGACNNSDRAGDCVKTSYRA